MGCRATTCRFWKSCAVKAELVGDTRCEDYTVAVSKTRDPYTRTRDAVYATGNKWAIENFNATHN